MKLKIKISNLQVSRIIVIKKDILNQFLRIEFYICPKTATIFMAKANVFYFNPTCELAVANGSFSYIPPLLLQKMERDLEMIPFVFTTENDFVLTDDAPSEEFKHQLIEAGFELPTFCNLAELISLPTNSFNAIYPWGWSPAAHFKLKSLKEKCGGEFKTSVVFNWTNEHKMLLERSSSLEFLINLLDKYPCDWFIDRLMIGVRVSDVREIETLLLKNRALVLKAPVSSSGRGIQVIRKATLNNSNKQWISGVLKQHKYLIAEPFLEKMADLSFQFQISSNSKIDYLGFSFFETNSNGQYLGTLLHPDLNKILGEVNPEMLKIMIESTAKAIREALNDSLYAQLQRGYLGVDAMIFKHQKKIMIQPCIEINCRMNMGILSMQLEKKIHPKSRGNFKLFYERQRNFKNFVLEQKKINPTKILDNKLCSGFLSLIEPNSSKTFGAYINIYFDGAR